MISILPEPRRITFQEGNWRKSHLSHFSRDVRIGIHAMGLRLFAIPLARQWARGIFGFFETLGAASSTAGPSRRGLPACISTASGQSLQTMIKLRFPSHAEFLRQVSLP